ncbi:Ig-like domain-containing protein [Aquimarina algicola]|uniref:T9SS type A sorting domain-containing protein n=1 Tax=Aquimarina algicola TaxID=2589995 RepID=A0A504J6Z9_9FLAO|nr:Ig-like domain-containing protein [Aquimarina algicola]TPN83373.1 T9SS type A sorting domain-containing protein [Aquimarina algicola]
MKLNSLKSFLYHRYWIFILFVFSMIFSISAQNQIRVGDPEVTFDTSKYDSRYPQMQEWQKAGVRGGIPHVKDIKIVKTLEDGANSADINRAINDASRENGLVAVFLKNGTYTINSKVSMKSNVSLIGESRDGVKCVIRMNDGDAFSFFKVNKSGIYTLTIEGSWGKPKYDWNYGINANDELRNNDNISVKIKDSRDCWLDKVNIFNSARDPLRVPGNHNTFRDLNVDGAHKKSGGAQGYFFVQGAYNLITGCRITHLRHISLQGGNVEYNVVYDNDFRQEVSFHSGDKGNNLIENNRITLPRDMPNGKADTPNAPYNSNSEPDYFAIMGPWSTQHDNSEKPNFVYKNNCLEENHNGATPWSDSKVLYKGPREVKPRNPATNFPALPESQAPKGGTLYPVVLGTVDNGNQKPIVRFIEPNNNQEFTIGVNIKPVVEAIDNDGTIRNVKLYLNNDLIGTDTNKPFEWGGVNSNDDELKDLKEGSYTLRAVATNNEGETNSSSITIKVKSSSNANTPPVLEFKSLSDGDTFSTGIDLKPVVIASDQDGAIEHVKLYLNDDFVRQESRSPYEWGDNPNRDELLKDLEDGEYTLKAIATDNDGAESTKTIQIFVGSSTTQPIIPVGSIVWIKSNQNQKYITVESNLKKNFLRADKGSADIREQFLVIDAGNGYVALQSKANDFFVSADRKLSNDIPLVADREEIGNWEKFEWISISDNQFALKAKVNDKYVQARISSQGAPLMARGSVIKGWETFVYETVSQKNSSLQSVIDIKAFPNPSKDYITITGIETGDQIIVHNLNGYNVMKATAKNDIEVLETNTLPKGVYIITILGKSKFQFIKN